jgi:hypothetical protein
MRVGDLVRVKLCDSDRRDRDSGVVLKFDVYRSDGGFGAKAPIVEILWPSGPSWVAKPRIEVIRETG